MRFAKVPKRPTDYVTSDDLLHDLLLVLKDVVAFESNLINASNGSGHYAGNGNGNGNGRYNGNGNGNGHHIPESEFAQLTLVIQKITDLYGRLNKRNLDVDQALVEASSQIGLDLKQLLHDCLRFPAVLPYARNLKGLRRLFLCYCGEQEISDRHGLGLCPECLESALECVQEKKKNNKFVLYSSHSPQVRCRHADFSTMLVTFYKPGQWPPAWCEICLKQEKNRLANK